jgi:hypothetical protein
MASPISENPGQEIQQAVIAYIDSAAKSRQEARCANFFAMDSRPQTAGAPMNLFLIQVWNIYNRTSLSRATSRKIIVIHRAAAPLTYIEER